jgi:glycosyltransferase involved in cell wall biosynthesis
LPEAASPRVSVIVPTYRDWDRLALLLASLERQSPPREGFEVIVVNNDPADPPPASLRLPGNARMLTEARKGSYAARNAGLAVAEGEILLFTDSDCVADPDWVREAVAFLDGHPDTARIGGRIDVAPSPSPGIADVYEAAFAFPQEKYVAAGWAPTANMGTWRRVLDAIGPFDDAHYSGGDKDWGLRAEAAGFAIDYVERAAVTHPPRTAGEILRKRRRIAGAMLNREIAARGRARLVPGWVFKTLKRLLPPTRQIGQLARVEGFPLHLKIATYLFIWWMRLDIELARGRILLFGAEPERR